MAARCKELNSIISDLLNTPVLTLYLHDGEEEHAIKSITEANEMIDNLDDFRLYLVDAEGKSAGWIYVVMSNEGDEQISDYTTGGIVQKIVEPHLSYLS